MTARDWVAPVTWHVPSMLSLWSRRPVASVGQLGALEAEPESPPLRPGVRDLLVIAGAPWGVDAAPVSASISTRVLISVCVCVTHVRVTA